MRNLGVITLLLGLYVGLLGCVEFEKRPEPHLSIISHEPIIADSPFRVSVAASKTGSVPMLRVIRKSDGQQIGGTMLKVAYQTNWSVTTPLESGEYILQLEDMEQPFTVHPIIARLSLAKETVKVGGTIHLKLETNARGGQAITLENYEGDIVQIIRNGLDQDFSTGAINIPAPVEPMPYNVVYRNSVGEPITRISAPVEPLYEWDKFVLPGHRVLNYAIGDLNNDGLEDMALILKKDNEPNQEKSNETTEGKKTTGDPLPLRPLLLLMRDPEKNTLHLAARSDKAVKCFYCGGARGDAFEGMKIEDGRLSLLYSGGTSWAWTITTQYKYDETKADWFIAKVSEGHGRLDPDASWKVKTKTVKDLGIITFENFNIYEHTL